MTFGRTTNPSDRLDDSLLGAMLRYPPVIDDVTVLVPRAEMLRTDSAQKVYKSILGLHGSKPVDLVAVAEDLRVRGWLEDVGGPVRLAEIWDCQATGANGEYYARLVRDDYVRRSLGTFGATLEREASDPSMPALDALADAERKLWSLAEVGTDGTVTELVTEYDEIHEAIDNREGVAQGLPSGLADWDRLTTGFQAGQLVIVAARPGVGKTAIAVTAARHLVMKEHVPVFFVSLEQSRLELAQRLVAGMARVDGRVLRQGRVDREEASRVWEATKRLKGAPLFVDDVCGQTAVRIAANARRLVRRHGVKCVFVDYLQLVEPEDKRAQRYEQVGAVTRRLKTLARDLGIPVVVLAQLGRGVEERKGKPRLADLRESGNIEADADSVLLLWQSEESDSDSIKIEADLAKQRNGPTGEFSLMFNKPYVLFENLAQTPAGW
jgi:replicative DNA helicase